MNLFMAIANYVCGIRNLIYAVQKRNKKSIIFGLLLLAAATVFGIQAAETGELEISFDRTPEDTGD